MDTKQQIQDLINTFKFIATNGRNEELMSNANRSWQLLTDFLYKYPFADLGRIEDHFYNTHTFNRGDLDHPQTESIEFISDPETVWAWIMANFVIDSKKSKDKYYFIAYQATNKDGDIGVWNDVINDSPMNFIKNIQTVEENGSRTYHGFVIINACEISREEFEQFKGRF